MIELLDYEIKPIEEVASSIGIDKEVLYPYGKYIAKVPYDYKSDRPSKSKLVLVTAMTPTKSGEGKTLTSIGLSMAMNRLGKKTITCLRQDSLGPVFGMKGACVGSGHATILPTEELCMGFNGDFDAITSANNLLSASIDNHIYQGNLLKIDTNRILWKRCLDVCDRSLKNIETGWTKKGEKTTLESHFDITAASEIMSIMTLASDLEDLRKRLGNILVAYDTDGNPIYSEQLGCVGSMMALLKRAFNPNLVQTCEGTPVLVHCGPFANISVGINSVVCTKLGMRLGDYVVTEAGFASELGAEKFLDIACRNEGIAPDCVVVVATIKALRHHGGSENECNVDVYSVKEGLKNLSKHIRNLQDVYHRKVTVVLNRFPGDSEIEIGLVERLCDEMNVLFSISDAFSSGSEGAMSLAKNVIHLCEREDSSELIYSYDENSSLVDKILNVSKSIYGAEGIEFLSDTEDRLKDFEKLGYNTLPVCIAKTQYSLTDNEKILNVSNNEWKLSVRDVELKSGAGLVVVRCGNIVTMPGLPKKPNYESIDVMDDRIIGLS